MGSLKEQNTSIKIGELYFVCDNFIYTTLDDAMWVTTINAAMNVNTHVTVSNLKKSLCLCLEKHALGFVKILHNNGIGWVSRQHVEPIC